MAVKATGGVVLAVVAQGLGHPDAALLAPAVQPIVDQFAGHLRRQAERLERMLDESAREAGMPADVFAHRIGESEARGVLLAESVDAAYATVDKAKLRALAAVLADGVVDDGRVEVSRLIVRALRQIEAPHVRVMAALRDRPADRTRGTTAVTTAELAELLPGLREAIGGLLGPLTATGCVETANATYADVQHRPYVVTDFGRRVLDYVRTGGTAGVEG